MTERLSSLPDLVALRVIHLLESIWKDCQFGDEFETRAKLMTQLAASIDRSTDAQLHLAALRNKCPFFLF